MFKLISGFFLWIVKDTLDEKFERVKKIIPFFSKATYKWLILKNSTTSRWAFWKNAKCVVLRFLIIDYFNIAFEKNNSPFQKYENLKQSGKITFFLEFFFGKKMFAEKKNYPLSFTILGGRDLTGALQSSPFQNPGGVPWAWRRMKDEGQRTEILVSNFR